MNHSVVTLVFCRQNIGESCFVVLLLLCSNKIFFLVICEIQIKCFYFCEECRVALRDLN